MEDAGRPTDSPPSNVIPFPWRREKARTAARDAYRRSRADAPLEDENPWLVALDLLRKERGEV